MNMLERFLSIEYTGQGEIFKGLSIWEDEKYRNLQGTWPVIFLSFADVKANTYAMAREKICMLIKEVYRKRDFLLAEGNLKEGETELFRRTLNGMTDSEAGADEQGSTDHVSEDDSEMVYPIRDGIQWVYQGIVT